MFKRLAEFWLVLAPGTVPGAFQALRHANDNRPGLRPAATGTCRSPTPVLTCHWFDRDGRLECRWGVQTGDDAPTTEASVATDLERRPHAPSFSAKAAGHPRAGFGSGHAALLHRHPSRDLPGSALMVEA